MKNQVATQSTVVIELPKVMKVHKAKQRLEQLLSEKGHLIGNNQRKVTGRNYFNAGDMPFYDDEMILRLHEEVENCERLKLIDVI